MDGKGSSELVKPPDLEPESRPTERTEAFLVDDDHEEERNVDPLNTQSEIPKGVKKEGRRSRPSFHQRGCVIQNTGHKRKSRVGSEYKRFSSVGDITIDTAFSIIMSDEDEEVETMAMYHDSKWHIIANVIFVIGSAFYLWSYIVELKYYEEEYDDDVLTMIGDDERGTIDKFILISGFGSFSFIPMVFIEITLSSHLCWPTVLNIMTLGAAIAGVAAALLTHYHPSMSSYMDIVSCNLWWIEGICLFVLRIREPNNPTERFCGLSLHNFGLIADCIFLFTTTSDAIMSYVWTFAYDDTLFMQAVVLASGSGWVLSSLIYVIMSVYDHVQYRRYCVEVLDEDKLKFIRLSIDSDI